MARCSFYVLLLVSVVAAAACDRQANSPMDVKPTPDVAQHARITPPAPVAAPSPDDHSARFEIYSNNSLRFVFRGADAVSNQPFSPAEIGAMAGLADLLDKRPINNRSAKVANLFRNLDKLPQAQQGKELDNRVRALMKQTQYTVKTLGDGTRVIEYFFDGLLAGRVIKPAAPKAEFVAAADVATGGSCTDCWTEADEIYYFGIIVYVEEQAAAIDFENSQLYLDPTFIAAMDTDYCLKEYFNYLTASAALVSAGAGAKAGWEAIESRVVSGSLSASDGKALRIALVSGLTKIVQSYYNAWNAFHDCLWKSY